MGKKSLQLEQLNSKMLGFAALKQVAMPPTGWIKAIRTAIGMTMQQLGNKLNVSKQGVMDMQLVYGFVPNDGSLDALIEKRATELATKIVMRTANTMKLEEQANSKKRLEAAIKERATAIQNEMPKILWD